MVIDVRVIKESGGRMQGVVRETFARDLSGETPAMRGKNLLNMKASGNTGPFPRECNNTVRPSSSEKKVLDEIWPKGVI